MLLPPARSPPPPPAVQGQFAPLSGLAIGVKFGLAGIGFDVATPLIHQWLNLRGGAPSSPTRPAPSPQTTSTSTEISSSRTPPPWSTRFPFHGRFRLSGGVTLYNDTGLTATLSVPTGQSFTVGGTTYYSEPYNAVTNPAGPILAPASSPSAATRSFRAPPSASAICCPKKGHFRFESEIGFQYFSAPTVQYTFTGTGCQNYTAPNTYSNCGPIPQANITTEQNKLQNDLYDLRFFPILSFGLSYKIH